MKLIGNILWFICAGLGNFIAWSIAGIACYLTIIGIPFGNQCFKLAQYGLAPFGKKLVPNEYAVSGLSLLGNIAWLLTFGWTIALAHVISALLLVVFIVTIPFAPKQLAMARLAFAPFGVSVTRE